MFSFLLPLLFGLLAVLILFAFNPSQFSFYPICFFYRTTGLLCPGCGSLRALHQLLHGNVLAAFHFNALLVLSLPLAARVALRLATARLQHRPMPLVTRPAWLWIAFAVLVIFGILRNLPFAAFAWLAP